MPSLSIDNFRTAATTLGGNEQIHLKTDKTGLAVGWCQRFKVTFGDTFRWKSTIAARQQEAVNTFLESIRREYGKDMGDIAAPFLRRVLAGGAPLTARVVQDTLAMLDGRGGQHWLKNEHLANQFSRTCLPPSRWDEPSLSSVLEPQLEEILSVCREKGMSPEQVEKYAKRYSTGGMIGIGPGGGISDRIADALRQEGTRPSPEGRTYVPLGEPRAREVATRVVRETIVSEINQELTGSYLAAHPFAEAFAAKARERGMEGQVGLMPPLRKLDEIFHMAVANSPTVLSAAEMGALMDTALNAFFDRQQEKMENITRLGLPPGRAKDELTRLALGTRSRMDGAHFDRIATVAGQLSDQLQAVANAPTPKARTEAALALGRTLSELNVAGGLQGADDVNLFLKMASAVFEARNGPEAMAALREVVRSPAMEETYRAVVAIKNDERTEPVTSASASTVLRVFNEFRAPTLA
jgi:hypothetical protein